MVGALVVAQLPVRTHSSSPVVERRRRPFAARGRWLGSRSATAGLLFDTAFREAETRTASALVISEICFFREGIVAALEDAPEIGAVTGAAQAPQPEDDAPTPDVVVVDLATTQSLSVIAAVRRAAPDARIVALGADREEQALACARASVRGFVTRDQSLDELVSAVVEVARGRELCPPSVGVLLLQGHGRPRRAGAAGAATRSPTASSTCSSCSSAGCRTRRSRPRS